MGLDKRIEKCLTKTWAMKLLSQLGLGLARLLGFERKTKVSPFEKERQTFEKEVRDQLIKLKEKGISIPIFTL